MSIKNKLTNVFAAAPLLAQQIEFKPGGGTDQFNSLFDLKPEKIVSGAISLVMLVVALVFFFMLVLGGLKWVMSGGDQKAVEAARAQITNALIGLAIVFAAWAIMQLIKIIFGVDVFGGITIPSFTK